LENQIKKKSGLKYIYLKRKRTKFDTKRKKQIIRDEIEKQSIKKMIRTTKITIKRVKIIFYTKIKYQWMKLKDKLIQSRIQELKE
jgi:hypothetical protein